MAKSNNLSKELKALGKDLSSAIKTMLKSQEFKHLEKELVTSAKSISKSIGSSFAVARKSASGKRFKRRLGRVVKKGADEGKAKAKKAQAKAAQNIRKVRQAIKKLKKKH